MLRGVATENPLSMISLNYNIQSMNVVYPNFANYRNVVRKL